MESDLNEKLLSAASSRGASKSYSAATPTRKLSDVADFVSCGCRMEEWSYVDKGGEQAGPVDVNAGRAV